MATSWTWNSCKITMNEVLKSLCRSPGSVLDPLCGTSWSWWIALIHASPFRADALNIQDSWRKLPSVLVWSWGIQNLLRNSHLKIAVSKGQFMKSKMDFQVNRRHKNLARKNMKNAAYNSQLTQFCLDVEEGTEQLESRKKQPSPWYPGQHVTYI